MRSVPLTDQHGEPITPEGCGWEDCIVAKRKHVQLWSPSGGWHVWEQPTTQQIARRARALRQLADAKLITDGERKLAEDDATAFARWLHDGDLYGKAER